MATPLIGGIGLGIFVDTKLEIEDSIFTLGGILLGIIVAGWAVYLLIKPLISEKHK